MHLDGFFFNALVREIRPQVAGARVEDVYGSPRGSLIIQLRAPGQTRRLEIPLPPRSFFLSQAPPEQKIGTPLAQAIKKHIDGYFCHSLTNPPFERLATLAFSSAPEEAPGFFLHLEVMGRQNDLFFCREDRVIATTRTAKQGTARPLLPGDLYSPPARPAKALPLHLESAALALLLSLNPDCSHALLNAVFGLGPLLAQEICAQAGLGPVPAHSPARGAPDRLAAVLADLGRASLEEKAEPVLYEDLGPYWRPLTHLPPPERTFSSLSAALAFWFCRSREENREGQLRRQLAKALATAALKAQSTLAKQKIELSRAQGFSLYRETGDTLLASLAAVPRGASAVTLENVYGGGPLTIALNPALSASANAAYYYKKYNKYKTATAKVAKLIAANQELLAYLDSLQYTLEAAQSLAELQAVRAEAEENGLVKGPRAIKAVKLPPPDYHRFFTEGGTPVWVGKNNRQNEWLTLQAADKEHYWLHCRRSPGSHVILCSKAPGEADLAYAAALAAWYSRERSSPKVEVVWTQVKNVKKIPGAKPGQVRYTEYRSLFIPPRSG